MPYGDGSRRPKPESRGRPDDRDHTVGALRSDGFVHGSTSNVRSHSRDVGPDEDRFLEVSAKRDLADVSATNRAVEPTIRALRERLHLDAPVAPVTQKPESFADERAPYAAALACGQNEQASDLCGDPLVRVVGTEPDSADGFARVRDCDKKRRVGIDQLQHVPEPTGLLFEVVVAHQMFAAQGLIHRLDRFNLHAHDRGQIAARGMANSHTSSLAARSLCRVTAS